jgi:hypothetical protein
MWMYAIADHAVCIDLRNCLFSYREVVLHAAAMLASAVGAINCKHASADFLSAGVLQLHLHVPNVQQQATPQCCSLLALYFLSFPCTHPLTYLAAA